MTVATGKYINVFGDGEDIFIIINEPFSDELDPLEVTEITKIVEGVVANTAYKNSAERWAALDTALSDESSFKCLQWGYQLSISAF